MMNPEEKPIDIWIFDGDDSSPRACSKRVAAYIANKVKAIIAGLEVQQKKIANQDDFHYVMEYVLDGIRDRFVIQHGDAENGKEYNFLDFETLPEDYDIFVTNFKQN